MRTENPPERTPPAFSILAPAYRTEQYLAETIDSVVRQTRRDWELIVVDNGMSEPIAEIVRSYRDDPRVRLIRQENRGIGGGVDAAAAVARGRYFTVLPTDDQLMPEYCERMGAVLDCRPEIDALGCDAYVFVEPSGRELRRTHLQQERKRVSLKQRVTLTEYLHRPFLFAHGAFRRAAWEAVGGFRSEPPRVEDLSLWLRLLNAGFSVRAIPEVLVRLRVRNDSESGDFRNWNSVAEGAIYHLTKAAHESGRPADLEALDRSVRRLRSEQAMHEARFALRRGDVRTARDEVAKAYGLRRSTRRGAILAGLTVAPELLRGTLAVKQLVAGLAGRVADGVATRRSRRGAPW